MDLVRMGRFYATFLVTTPLLVGCISNGLPKGVALEDTLPPAALPRPLVGDQLYFSNGRRERVTAVAGERVTWRRSEQTWFTALSDFTQPALFKQTRRYETTQRTTPTSGALWPVALNTRVSFQSTRLKRARDGSGQVAARQSWYCEVDRAERLTLAAGTFDTYRIACSRSDDFGKLKQRVYWYYAPRIGQLVLQIDQYPTRSPKRLELVAFQPSLAGISDASRADYQAHFQQTLERVASGTLARWRDPAGSAAITVTPVRTLKLEEAIYCRNFEVEVSSGGHARLGAGLACRDSDGTWRVPRKVTG